LPAGYPWYLVDLTKGDKENDADASAGQIDTPMGPLWIICDEQYRLRAVEWEEHSDRMEQLLDLHYRHEGYQRVAATNPGGLSRKLADYFAGDLALSTRFLRQRRARLSA
jgi:O6-methylguanine-DNA--protein-cysteine methyltransferase